MVPVGLLQRGSAEESHDIAKTENSKIRLSSSANTDRHGNDGLVAVSRYDLIMAVC